jgi:phycocyanin beta chain
MKESALEIVGDPSGITAGDCTVILAEVASYFDRAAAAVA